MMDWICKKKNAKKMQENLRYKKKGSVEAWYGSPTKALIPFYDSDQEKIRRKHHIALNDLKR